MPIFAETVQVLPTAFSSFGTAEWLTVIGLVAGFVGWLFRMDRLLTGMKATLDAEAKSTAEFKASSMNDREHLWDRMRENERDIKANSEKIVQHGTLINGHEKQIDEHRTKLEKWDSWKRNQTAGTT